MFNITAIVLTLNEEIHIERCIKSLQPLATRIFVVDSYSTDHTVEIAQSLGADVVQRKWKNYADQFQWAIDQCDSDSQWIMRVDADEYLEPELKCELQELLTSISPEIDGIYLKLKVFFFGKWIRYGGFYPLVLLRLWRRDKGRIEQRWMDEHIVLAPGAKTITAHSNFIEDNLKGITFWVTKHNSYASREAVDLLNNKYHFIQQDQALLTSDDSQAKHKRFIKESIYSKMPTGFRAFLYFFYRYFLLLGFLDGPKGFLWHFLQGFWYRLLVDIKINEVENSCKGDIGKMKEIFVKEHGLNLH